MFYLLGTDKKFRKFSYNNSLSSFRKSRKGRNFSNFAGLVANQYRIMRNTYKMLKNHALWDVRRLIKWGICAGVVFWISITPSIYCSGWGYEQEIAFQINNYLSHVTSVQDFANAVHTSNESEISKIQQEITSLTNQIGDVSLQEKVFSMVMPGFVDLSTDNDIELFEQIASLQAKMNKMQEIDGRIGTMHQKMSDAVQKMHHHNGLTHGYDRLDGIHMYELTHLSSVNDTLSEFNTKVTLYSDKKVLMNDLRANLETIYSKFALRCSSGDLENVESMKQQGLALTKDFYSTELMKNMQIIALDSKAGSYNLVDFSNGVVVKLPQTLKSAVQNDVAGNLKNLIWLQNAISAAIESGGSSNHEKTLEFLSESLKTTSLTDSTWTQKKINDLQSDLQSLIETTKYFIDGGYNRRIHLPLYQSLFDLWHGSVERSPKNISNSVLHNHIRYAITEPFKSGLHWDQHSFIKNRINISDHLHNLNIDVKSFCNKYQLSVLNEFAETMYTEQWNIYELEKTKSINPWFSCNPDTLRNQLMDPDSPLWGRLINRDISSLDKLHQAVLGDVCNKEKYILYSFSEAYDKFDWMKSHVNNNDAFKQLYTVPHKFSNGQNSMAIVKDCWEALDLQKEFSTNTVQDSIAVDIEPQNNPFL